MGGCAPAGANETPGGTLGATGTTEARDGAPGAAGAAVGARPAGPTPPPTGGCDPQGATTDGWQIAPAGATEMQGETSVAVADGWQAAPAGPPAVALLMVPLGYWDPHGREEWEWHPLAGLAARHSWTTARGSVLKDTCPRGRWWLIGGGG